MGGGCGADAPANSLMHMHKDCKNAIARPAPGPGQRRRPRLPRGGKCPTIS